MTDSDACQHLAFIEGLSKIIVRSRCQPFNYMLLVRLTREEDDIAVGLARRFTDSAAQYRPFKARHIPVGNYNLGFVLLKESPAIAPICSDYQLIAVPRQRLLDEVSVDLRVVRNQDFHISHVHQVNIHWDSARLS